MKKEEIKQLAGKYLNDIIKQRNPENWMEYITDSWMQSAETWFCNEYEIATGFACPQDKIDIFKLYLYTEANKACDKKYGVRNGYYMVNAVYNDIQGLQESLGVAIEMFENSDNKENEYLPITEIKDVIEHLKASEEKLSKLVKLSKFVD